MFRTLVKRIHGEFPCTSEYLNPWVRVLFMRGKIKGTNDVNL